MKRRAVAIAIRRHTPFYAILDFMYGTPERARMTFAFACFLAALGCLMNIADSNASMVCYN
jgi:hypothetical protein